MRTDIASSPPSKAEDTATRLLETAIRLWGARGMHGVSLREITREAGVLNESAIRYYFKNKAGLIRAALEHVESQLRPLRAEALAELGNAPELEDVVKASAIPWVILNYQNPSSAQFTARMIREEGAEGQDMLLSAFGDGLWEIEARLAKLLPQKSAKALRLHYFLAINNVLNGMCDLSLLNRLPGIQETDGSFQLEPEELLQGFLE